MLEAVEQEVGSLVLGSVKIDVERKTRATRCYCHVMSCQLVYDTSLVLFFRTLVMIK